MRPWLTTDQCSPDCCQTHLRNSLALVLICMLTVGCAGTGRCDGRPRVAAELHARAHQSVLPSAMTSRLSLPMSHWKTASLPTTQLRWRCGTTLIFMPRWPELEWLAVT